MSRTFLDRYGGMTEYLHEGPDGEFAIEQVEDVQPLLDAIKRRQVANNGYTPSRLMRHVASIPPSLWMLWERQYGVGFHKDQRLFRRLLNDPDLRGLRVSHGDF